MIIARFLTLSVFCVATISAYAQPAEQMKQLAAMGAQLSGGNARIATEICQIDQEQIDAYKDRARRAFAADENFGGNWIIGWNSQQEAIDAFGISSLDEYAQKSSQPCAEIGKEIKP